MVVLGSVPHEVDQDSRSMLKDDLILPDPYNEQVAVSNEFFYQEMLR